MYKPKIRENYAEGTCTSDKGDKSSLGGEHRYYEAYERFNKRLEVAKRVLDQLLKPPNRQLTQREKNIYRQAQEELKLLSRDRYAINAHQDKELASWAARRAHLKALAQPGESRPQWDLGKKTLDAWEPNGEWAQCARDIVSYDNEVKELEETHQKIEYECDVFSINKAIDNVGNGLWFYEEVRQQKAQRYCQNLKTSLETIRDYFKGFSENSPEAALAQEPIGIGSVSKAWDWIKKSQIEEEGHKIVDIRQTLKLQHPEDTSTSIQSFPG